MEERDSRGEQPAANPTLLQSQNTRILMEQLTRTFSQKFENPLIERSPQCIIDEVGANIKVTHSLSRNLEDDLRAIGELELAGSLASIRSFTEYIVQFLCRTMSSLSESNSNLLKNRIQKREIGHVQCQLCSRRLEQVKIHEVKERLEATRFNRLHEYAMMGQLYGEQEAIVYEEANSPPFFEGILTDMIANRNNIRNINNDKTVQMLEDYLKNLFATDTTLEFEPGDHSMINKFRTGKDTVDHLYDNLNSELQRYAKKDIMPVVHRLSKELMRIEQLRRLKERVSYGCQTIELPTVEKAEAPLKQRHTKDKSGSPKRQSMLITEPAHGTRRSTFAVNQNKGLALVSKTISIQQAPSKKNNGSSILKAAHRNQVNKHTEDDTSSEVGCQTIPSQGTDKTTQTQPPLLKPPSHSVLGSLTVAGRLSSNVHDYSFLKTASLEAPLLNTSARGRSLLTDDTVVEESEDQNQYWRRNGECRVSMDTVPDSASLTQQNSARIKEQVTIGTEQRDSFATTNKEGHLKKPQRTTRTIELQRKHGSVKAGHYLETGPPKGSNVLGVKDLNLERYSQSSSVLGGALEALTRLGTLKTKPLEKDDLKLTRGKGTHMQHSGLHQVVENTIVEEDASGENSALNSVHGEGADPPVTVEIINQNLTDLFAKMSAYAVSPPYLKKIINACEFALANELGLTGVDIVGLLRKHCRQLPACISTNEKQESPREDRASSIEPEQLNKQKSEISGATVAADPSTSTITITTKGLKQLNKSLHSASSPLRLPLLNRSKTNSEAPEETSSATKENFSSDLSRIRYKNDTEVCRVTGSNIYVRRSTRPDESVRNLFKFDDLLLFGGVAQAYEFELLCTKNSLSKLPSYVEKRNAIAECQLTPEHQQIIRVAYSSLQEMREGCRSRYQLIKSFLRYPYQTVCNDFSELDGNDHMSFPSFSEAFGMILRIHRRCQETGLCRHLQRFLKKIGLRCSPTT